MAVYRIHKDNNYTVMSNLHLRNKRMSWKAKGLLSTMLSLPEKWDYSIHGLETLASDKETATRTGLTELEQFGHLVRKPIKSNGKIIDWQYDIFEKPLVENPQVEKPLVENQTQLNTYSLNTEQENTNLYTGICALSPNGDALKKEKHSSSNPTITQEIIEHIVKSYNSICQSLSKVEKISESRKRDIRVRLNNGYSVEDFIKAFNNAEDSDFLKGKVSNFKADFDWIINDRNLVKILEGKYNKEDRREVIPPYAN